MNGWMKGEIGQLVRRPERMKGRELSSSVLFDARKEEEKEKESMGVRKEGGEGEEKV